MLFFAKRPEIRDAKVDSDRDFVDEYERAADRLIQVALHGRRLDPSRHLPTGSYPPAVVDGLLRAARGFNPEQEFPQGSFARPWPFVGARLGPPPATPPTRRLIYKSPDSPIIVGRGEIPTVHVPRSDRREEATIVAGDPARSLKPCVQPSWWSARDPP